MSEPMNLDENTSFERARARVGDICDELESGKPSLETSLALYEEAVRLIAHARARIEAFETRVELVAADGSTTEFAGGRRGQLPLPGTRK